MISRERMAAHADLQSSVMRAVEFTEAVANDPQISEGELRSALRGVGEALEQLRQAQDETWHMLVSSRMNALMLGVIAIASTAVLIWERAS